MHPPRSFSTGFRIATRAERTSILVVIGCLFAGLTFSDVAQAQHTPAGTSIVNTAVLSHAVDGQQISTKSNTVALAVDTLVDVSATAQDEVVEITAAGVTTGLYFRVQNSGNAAGRFVLSAKGDDGVALVVRENADDSSAALPHLNLQPGEQRLVYVLVPPAPPIGRVTLTAIAAVGQGAPGTALPGLGTEGTSIVLGPSGGVASASTTLVRRSTAPMLNKSYTVVAPDGRPRAVPGSVITYRLDATLTPGTVGAEIVDPLPQGTEFVPGSILLDDRPQTDVADQDAATFDGANVRVALGDAPSAALRSVRFQVKIK